MIRSWFGLWCHTNGVGDGGFKGGMKGPLCAHQLEGCTVFHHTHIEAALLRRGGLVHTIDAASCNLETRGGFLVCVV